MGRSDVATRQPSRKGEKWERGNGAFVWILGGGTSGFELEFVPFNM